MAFPFARTPSGLRTPEALQGHGSPKSKSRTLSFSPIHPHPVTYRWAKRITMGLAVVALICFVLTWSFNYRQASSMRQLDRVPFTRKVVEDLLVHFTGAESCGLTSSDVYLLPHASKSRHNSLDTSNTYCPNRAKLLAALGGGGRHGFGAPYHPIGCHYRWYSTAEICLILDRFASIVFIGDGMVWIVYAGLNMLLREDVSLGALKGWETGDGTERVQCSCEGQVMNDMCKKYAITSSLEAKEVDENGGHGGGYYCERTPHAFLNVAASPAPEETLSGFREVLAKAQPYPSKPLAVILSVSSAATYAIPLANSFLDEWLALIASSGQNAPILWLGPPTAPYDIPEDKILAEGNDARWRFSLEMENQARERGLDSLGMWNLTVQVGNGGLGLSLVQAMMIVNWLSRLEST